MSVIGQKHKLYNTQAHAHIYIHKKKPQKKALKIQDITEKDYMINITLNDNYALFFDYLFG